MALREQIDAEKCLETIGEVEKVLAEQWESIGRNQVAALKLRVDAAFKKLAKILPDVKAVEHDPGEHAEELTRERINERLAELYARTNSRANGRGGEGAAVSDSDASTTH